MEIPNSGVKPGDETPTGEPAVKKVPEGSEPVKTPVDITKAEELLGQDKRILVDKDRFNDRNDKAKLYETFAPLIEKIKDKPELVAELLETKQKGSLEDRVAQMEEERKTERRQELTSAVKTALDRWPGFDKEWPEIKDQVDMFIKRGVSALDAIKRSYLALHPEEAQAEAERVAKSNANALGQFSSSGGGGGRAPNVIHNVPQDAGLNEREKKVAQDLLGKDYGGGFVPVKSEQDYAALLKKHESYLRAKGFYDLP